MIVFLLAGNGAARAQTGVTVELEQFGVGSAFRPGGITAIRIKLTSNLAEATNLWVQWQVPNADGDIAECGRSTAISPKQVAYTWLYGWLPPDANAGSVWTVRVFEERDGVRLGEVGGARISPTPSPSSTSNSGSSLYVDLAASMIAVVGEKRLGLDDYGKIVSNNRARPIYAHEDTQLAAGIKPSELPDRWYGLMPFEAVVWAGSSASPQELGVGQSEAIREYVRRGGHLIVCLPASGNAWGMGQPGMTSIEDLLPCRTPNKAPRVDEAVSVETLLPVLAKSDNVRRFVTGSKIPDFPIRVFKDFRDGFSVIDNHFEPLICLPDGRVVAVQRWFGMGRVTVIGIDLADGQLGSLGLPQADAFWNRILGRVIDTPGTDELKQTDDAHRLARGDANENAMGSGTLITGNGGISMSGDAGVGLLVALVLFIVYWLAAGPAGFAILKHYGQTRHAWVSFAALAAVFTAIAWGVVMMLGKPSGVSHITILDHIARTPDDPRSEEPQFQRGISYFSAYLPRYGKTPVSIASESGQLDLLASWTPPGPPSPRFPNVDQYRIDVARSPGSYDMPSRATATQMYANWLGALDPKWGSMLQSNKDDPIRTEIGPDGREALHGTLVNLLPAPLKDVSVIWVRSKRMTRRTYDVESGRETPWIASRLSGQLNNVAAAWRVPMFDAGASLELFAGLPAGRPLQLDIDARYIAEFKNRDPASIGNLSMSADDRRQFLEMMSLFNQLTPPTYLKDPNNNEPETVAFRRELGRELDLSAWFSRPCLIVMGFLEESACPVPLRIGGSDQPVTGKGLTMVRWIYPLPLREEIAFDDVLNRIVVPPPPPGDARPAAPVPPTPPS